MFIITKYIVKDLGVTETGISLFRYIFIVFYKVLLEFLSIHHVHNSLKKVVVAFSLRNDCY